MSENTAIQSELGPLLEEINKKGVAEAEGKKEVILSDAEAQASKIIAEAKKQSAAIIKKANDEAAKTKEIVEADLQQASKSVLKICKNSLEDLFASAFNSLLEEKMSSDTAVIAEVINLIAGVMAEGKEIDVELDSAVDEQKLKSAILSKVNQEIAGGMNIRIAPGMNGIAVSKKGESFSYEVTPTLVADAMYKMLSRISNEVLGSRK